MFTVLTVVILVILTVPYLYLHTYMMAVLWGWYVVPLGLPAIGLAHMWGLSCLIAIYNFHNGPKKQFKTKRDQVQDNIIVILRPFLIFGLAAIGRLFM